MRLISLCFLFAIAQCAIVGIDLGHQFTKAIMVAPGISFDVIFTDEGKRKDASTLYLKPFVEGSELEDTERVYGSQIGSLCTRFPGSCAPNLKALLGKCITDDAVRHYIEHHPGVQIIGNPERNNSVMLELGTSPAVHPFSVEELTGMTLNNLKLRVLKALEAHPQARSVAEDVAVSVPPFANQITRMAYLDVLSLGEFSSVLGLVDEGVAAALAYINGRKFSPEEYDEKKSFHVIYDVGAGSTTATLFSFIPYKNKTIAVDVESFGYDASFGGELLTHNVYDILHAKFLAQFGLDDTTELSPKLIARLLEASEKAKTILSANSDYRVSLESFYQDKDFKATISRQEFEDYSSDSAERAIQPIIDALNLASSGKMSVNDIESVILNGGSTRTPFIQKQLIALLGGEEKISKVVNTDEACALGTTIRAYQLKMMTGSADIVLNDRIFSDFEISVNDSEKLDQVFVKGSVAGNKTDVVLGNVSEDLTVSLYENGQLVLSSILSNLVKRGAELKCPLEEQIVVGSFEVDHNKIFSLREVNIRCPAKSTSSTDSSKTEVSKLSSETVAKELEETPVYDEKFFNFTKPKPRNQLRIPVTDLRFSNLRPLNTTEKRGIAKKLRQLNAKDEEKVALQEKKNELEGLCYSLRSFVEDNYENLMAEAGEEDLELAKELVSEIIEWLEYDSDRATFEEINFKMTAILGNKEKLSRVHKIIESDLSLPELKKMLEEGLGVKKQVSAFLEECESQLATVKKDFAEGNFDFDSEDEKIMAKLYGSKKSQRADALGNHYENFLKALEALEKVVKLPSKKFLALTKEDLFEKSEGVTSLIYKMMDDVVSILTKHKERVEFLLTRLDKLKKRQAQKEFRLKKKEAAKEEAAEKIANATDESPSKEKPADPVDEPVRIVDETIEDVDPDTVEEQVSSKPENTADALDVDHDEL